jgi:VWFA-related protein
MRKWATLLLLWAIAWPAMAEKTMSIEQVEELLFKLQGKPDGKVAGELEDVQVSERVSPARLARWEADFPGKRTREELMKLADMTSFLNPPASDVLRDPPPDVETQQRMLALAVEYFRQTTARLPNFYATRETTHFEDTLSHRADYSYVGSKAMGASGTLGGLTQTPGMASTTEYRGLHSTGDFSMTVTYRDGHEVLNEDTEKREKEEEAGLGLTSSGEFGPTLGAVIKDVAQTGLSWLRWEKGDSEPAAVFRYEVPANQSHFRIGITVEGREQAIFPAYHGEIEIDPATGEILRLSEVADSAPPNQAMRAAIVVDYAPVKIGDQSYVCPVRGVAFSMVPVPGGGATDDSALPVQVNLNDVAFTRYHEFGSEARIVANASDGGGAAPGGSGAPETDGAESPASAGAPAATAAPASTGAAAETASGSAPPATEETPATPAEAAVTPASTSTPNPASETTTAPASNPAANPAGDATEASTTSPHAGAISNAPAAGTVLHAQSNLVVLDVEVTDHDKPVKELDRSRFHVFEDGHEVPISSFEEHEPPASVEIAKAPTLPPDTYSNLPVYPETSAVNVLLLDALNTPMGDQEQVRKQMIPYLGTIKPGTALAIFTLSSRLRMVAGFTTDEAKLKQALESRKPSARSSADVGANTSESNSSTLVQAASSIATSNDPGTRWLVGQIMQFAADTQAYETDQRVTMTIDALSELARYLTAIPGKKNLIWFSGSFPIGLSPDAMLSTQIKDVGDYSIDMQRTSALLSAARVSVYPVDARGLTTAPAGDSSYTPPLATLQGVGRAVANDNNNSAMQTSQDQSTMSTIATETGGRAYLNSNGLKEAVEKIVAEGSSYYSLSYVPPEETGGKHGDDFRRVEVKVDGSKYQLSYRRGYYTDEGSKPASGAGGVPGAVTAAAVLGAPPSTQIVFQARVLPEGDPALTGPMPENELKNNLTGNFKGAPHRYVADLGVQLEDLTFAEGADGARTARLEIALVAYDAAGEPVNSLGRQFDLTLPAAQFEQFSAAGKGVPVRLMLDLPSGADVVRAVVYDAASAKIGSLEIPVQVTDAGTVAGPSASSN